MFDERTKMQFKNVSFIIRTNTMISNRHLHTRTGNNKNLNRLRVEQYLSAMTLRFQSSATFH